jgi:RNA polymerase sigma-70 factor (ECF subfamily)
MLLSKEACEKYTDMEIIKMSLKNVDYFACIYTRYESRLLRYIRRITSTSENEAEDILQEAFIKIWRNLNEFNPNLRFSSWIYRIVHNEAISHWRKSQHIEQLHAVNDLERIIFEQIDQDVAFKIDDEQKENKVISKLNTLSAHYREILILRFFENLSYEEISDILKIPEGTVATRINRAKKALRRKWKTQ